MKLRYGDQANKVREMCARKEGASCGEIAKALGRSGSCATSYVYTLLNRGNVVKAGTCKYFRFFVTKADADAYNVKAKQDEIERKEAQRLDKNAKASRRERELRAKIRKNPDMLSTEKYVKFALAEKLRNQKRAERERNRRNVLREAKGLSLIDRIEKLTKKKPLNLVIRTKQQNMDQIREHKAATIVWPEHVKVQVIPTPQDMRFKADPGYRGEFAKEWQERRTA